MIWDSIPVVMDFMVRIGSRDAIIAVELEKEKENTQEDEESQKEKKRKAGGVSLYGLTCSLGI